MTFLHFFGHPRLSGSLQADRPEIFRLKIPKYLCLDGNQFPPVVTNNTSTGSSDTKDTPSMEKSASTRQYLSVHASTRQYLLVPASTRQYPLVPASTRKYPLYPPQFTLVGTSGCLRVLAATGSGGYQEYFSIRCWVTLYWWVPRVLVVISGYRRVLFYNYWLLVGTGGYWRVLLGIFALGSTAGTGGYCLIQASTT